MTAPNDSFSAPKTKLGWKIVLVLGGLVAGLLLMEVGLRVWPHQSFDGYYIWPPNFSVTYTIDPQVTPGIQGDSRFIINSQGIRGPEPPTGPAYLIATVGGSTTECLFLDQTETWQHLVQAGLAERTGRTVWVGNVGASGRSTREHIFQVELLARRHHDLNAVIMLVGINDAMLRLRRGEHFVEGFLNIKGGARHHRKRAFLVRPLEPEGWLAKSAIYRAFAQPHIKPRPPEANKVPMHKESPLTMWRALRKRATIIDQMPDMAPGLRDYQTTLERIIKVLRARKIRPVFMTQPTMWKIDLEPHLAELMWLGSDGSKGCTAYYSLRVLAQVMDLYNQRLRKVCAVQGVECIDLAHKIPKNTTAFYDDCHFNESGARLVAKVVTDYLATHPPFAAGRTSPNN